MRVNHSQVIHRNHFLEIFLAVDNSNENFHEKAESFRALFMISAASQVMAQEGLLRDSRTLFTFHELYGVI